MEAFRRTECRTRTGRSRGRPVSVSDGAASGFEVVHAIRFAPLPPSTSVLREIRTCLQVRDREQKGGISKEIQTLSDGDLIAKAVLLVIQQPLFLLICPQRACSLAFPYMALVLRRCPADLRCSCTAVAAGAGFPMSPFPRGFLGDALAVGLGYRHGLTGFTSSLRKLIPLVRPERCRVPSRYPAPHSEPKTRPVDPPLATSCSKSA